MNIEQSLITSLSEISLALFRKNFFGIFHGSVSARVEMNKFIINKRDAIFDHLDDEDFILLYHKKDYRWSEASIDSSIHSNIYQQIPDSKFIIYAMPPFLASYSINNNYIVPKDYFGKKEFPKLKVYDPKNFDDWYERADVEISRFFQENDTDIMVIRGYGVYAHSRELAELAKKIAILESSCRILSYSSN